MESQEDNIIDPATEESGGAPIESGGAPIESGGAPIESGGAPIESGGAPIDDEDDATHIMFPEAWRSDPYTHAKLLERFQQDVRKLADEKYPDILLHAVAVYGTAVLKLRGFPDFLNKPGTSDDPESVSERRRAVFAVTAGMMLSLEALESTVSEIKDVINGIPEADEDGGGGADTQSSN